MKLTYDFEESEVFIPPNNKIAVLKKKVFVDKVNSSINGTIKVGFRNLKKLEKSIAEWVKLKDKHGLEASLSNVKTSIGTDKMVNFKGISPKVIESRKNQSLRQKKSK